MVTTARVDLNRALLDPGSVFIHPEDVVNDPAIGEHDKAEILLRWIYDVTELSVASEEGMNGGGDPALETVMQALRRVLPETGAERVSPTKHAARCRSPRARDVRREIPESLRRKPQ